MACERREKTGQCSHYKCPFSSETTHGYECVDIFHHKGYSFCEVGDNCVERCPYSFQKGSLKEKVIQTFDDY